MLQLQCRSRSLSRSLSPSLPLSLLLVAVRWSHLSTWASTRTQPHGRCQRCGCVAEPPWEGRATACVSCGVAKSASTSRVAPATCQYPTCYTSNRHLPVEALQVGAHCCVCIHTFSACITSHRKSRSINRNLHTNSEEQPTRRNEKEKNLCRPGGGTHGRAENGPADRGHLETSV